MTDELNNLWHTEEYVAEIKTLRAEVERLTGELESAEENANSSHVYWKGAEVRADKAEAKLAEAKKTNGLGWMAAQVERKLREQAERERDEAQKNYQFMVFRAADNKLDGYRELGAAAAKAENERDTLKAKLSEVEAERDEWKVLRETCEQMFTVTRHRVLRRMGQTDLGKSWSWIEEALANSLQDTQPKEGGDNE